MGGLDTARQDCGGTHFIAIVGAGGSARSDCAVRRAEFLLARYLREQRVCRSGVCQPTAMPDRAPAAPAGRSTAHHAQLSCPKTKKASGPKGCAGLRQPYSPFYFETTFTIS